VIGSFGEQEWKLAGPMFRMAMSRMKYGCPEYVYVDPNAQMADEENGCCTTAVRKLLD
jgi:hypothetical protein